MEAGTLPEGGLTVQNPFRLVECRGRLLSYLWLFVSNFY